MYQPNLRELATSTGVPTGGIYGFMSSIKSAVSLMSASSLIVCWEGGHSARRKSLYEDYKHRESTEEETRDALGYTDYEYYVHQISWIKQILPCLGVKQLRVDGKEGDDILFQATRLIDGQKVIISEDSDFQCIISDDIHMYRPIKKQYISLANFSEVNGYKSPKHFLYSKVLLGDGSDNIPAVAKGVGATTVMNILNKIENEEEITPNKILSIANELGGSRNMKLVEAGSGPIIRNLNLIDISKEVFDFYEIKGLIDDIKSITTINVDKANKIFRALEFQPTTIDVIMNGLLRMANYPLDKLINVDYVRRYLAGETSVLQG